MNTTDSSIQIDGASSRPKAAKLYFSIQPEEEGNKLNEWEWIDFSISDLSWI